MAPTILLRCAALVLAALALAMPPEADAAAEALPEIEVSDPFVELHTGPGRGYPVFHVAARGERVQLLLASTDWIRLRTARGHEGWVPRAQLQGTLVAAGLPPSWRERWVETFLRQRLEFGAAGGRFAGEPMLKVFGRYRLGEALAVEATAGQVQGLYSGTDFWHLNAVVDPFSDRAWSPYFSVGVGRFRNVPNASLVEIFTTNANLANAGVGLRWHFGARFTLRVEATLYTALLSEQKSREYRALTGGMSFFF